VSLRVKDNETKMSSANWRGNLWNGLCCSKRVRVTFAFSRTRGKVSGMKIQ